MKTFILPATWLTDFKKMIRYPYDDIDANLSTYLNISLTNIATQYMGLKEDQASVEIWFPIITAEDRVKVAVFHLAATFYENPDIMLTNNGGTLVDKNQIFRILGGLTNYYTVDKLQKTQAIPETPIQPTPDDIWKAINKNIADIKINAGEIELLTIALNSLKNIVDTNSASIAKSDLIIAANTTNISANSNSITTLTTKVDKNVIDLTNLKTNVATNTTNIKTNTDNVASNLVKINTNITNITTNTNDILSTKTSLGNISTTLTKHTTDISENTKNIATNITAINTANTNITANTNNIAANLIKTNTNTTNIATNITAIAAIGTKTETNKTDIAANLVKINTNIANIMINTAKTGDLETALTATTNKVTTNTTNITNQAARIGTLETTTNNLVAKVDRTLVVNTEFATGEMLGSKPIYAKLVQQGNLKNNVDIASTGDLVASGVDLFLGIEYGVICRKNTLQLHNINAVNNLPDQHSSIIYQTASKISWYFNQSMTLTQFKNRPFLALIKYTKV